MDKKNILTYEGLKKLEDEIDYLKVVRPQCISWAVHSFICIDLSNLTRTLWDRRLCSFYHLHLIDKETEALRGEVACQGHPGRKPDSRLFS